MVTLIEDKILLLFCVLNNKLGGVDGYMGRLEAVVKLTICSYFGHEKSYLVGEKSGNFNVDLLCEPCYGLVEYISIAFVFFMNTS